MPEAKKPNWLVLAMSVACFGASALFPAPAYAKAIPSNYEPLYSTDFASGMGSCLTEPASVAITDAPGGGTGKVVKIDLSRENSASDLDFSKCQKIAEKRDYIIAWTSFIPADYLVDRNPERIFVIHQGAGNGPPPFSLSINGEHYEAQLSNGAASKQYDVGPAGGMGAQSGDKGYWVRWSLHYFPDASGTKSVTNLYKNETLVMTADGVPNAYQKDDDAYLTVGIDKQWTASPSSLLSKRTLYFGDITIAGKP